MRATVPAVQMHILICSLIFASTAFLPVAAEPADPSLPTSEGNWAGLIVISGLFYGAVNTLPTFAFGIHPSATDAFDRSLDQLSSPPHPDPTFPNAYFSNPAHDEPMQQVSKDYLSMPVDSVTGVAWTFVMDNRSPDTWTVGWDVFDLPEFWTELTIDDGAGPIDMRSTAGVDVPGGAIETYTIHLRVNLNEPPVFDAVSSVAIVEDDPTTITLTGVDAGADDETDQTLTFTVTSNNTDLLPDPVLSGNGSTRDLYLDPVADANGEAEVTVTVVDDGITGGLHSNTSTQTFTVTVTAVNDEPTIDGPLDQVVSEDAGAQVLTLASVEVGGGEDEATTQTITVEAFTSDESVIPTPTVTDTGTDWELTYEPAADVNTDSSGPVEITLIVSDDGAGAELDIAQTSVSFLVDVFAVNDPAVPIATTATTYQNIPVEITLAASDVEGDDLQYFVVSAPAGGSLDLASGDITAGEFVVTYTPDLDFSGSDAFTYAVNDGTEDSDAVEASVEVVGNESPVVTVEADFEVTVIQSFDLVIPLNIADSDSTEFVGEITIAAGGGLAVLAEDVLSVTYTPDSTFIGQDAFALTITDAEGATSDELAVVVEVTLPNQAPSIEEIGQVEVTKNVSALVIVNATDPDDDELTFEFGTFPENGAITQDGLVVTYEPLTGYVGTDLFSVIASDAEFTSNEVFVEIVVVNQIPFADGATDLVFEGQSVQIPLFGTDADGDEVTFVIVTEPGFGEAFIDGASATYTPDVGFSGPDTFEVAAFDGTDQSETVSVVVDVVAVNDAPVLSLDPAAELSAIPGEPLTIPLVIEDSDSEVFTLGIVSDPVQGFVELGADGFSVVYTAPAGAEGEDTFSLHAVDDGTEPATSADLVLIINLLILDQTPTVQDVGPLAGPKNNVIDVALVGEDPNADDLTYEVSREPENGGVVIEGSIAFYTPAEGFSGEDSFAYVAFDGEFTSSPAEVALTVENALPVADATSAPGVEDEPLTVELTGSDADGDPLTFEIVEPPRRGEAVLEGQTVTYTPRADFSGTDELSFVVNDGDIASDPAVVALDIAPFDDPAIINTERTLSDIRADEGELPRTLDLGDPTPLFTDPDSPVTIAAGSTDLEVVETFLDGTTLTLTFVNPGVATVEVSAAGADEVASFAVEVVALALRNDPPELQPLGSEFVVEGTDLLITPSATDPDADTLTWSFVSVERFSTAADGDAEPVVQVDPDTGATTFNVENITGIEAQFSVEIAVADEVNDPVSAAVFITVTSSNEPPVVSAPAEFIAEVDVALSFHVSVTDPDGDGVTILASVRERDTEIVADAQDSVRSFNVADVVLVGDESLKTFIFTPTDAVSGRILTLQWVADDGQDSSTGETQIQVGADVNLPPTMDAIDDVEVDEGGSVEVIVTAEDPDIEAGEELVVTVDGLPAEADFDAATGTISWVDIAYDRAASYTITATAVDAGGLDVSQTFRLRVIDVNRDPEITAASSASADAVPASISLQRLTVLTLDFAATDPDGDNVTLTVRGVPGWARIRQGGTPTDPTVSIELEPARDAEDLTASVSATDSGGSTVEVEITIVLEAPPNSAPTIEDVAPITVVEEETAEFAVETADDDGDELTVTATTVPDGATFEVGAFVWTPQRGQAQDAAYAIALTVDDGNGGQAETTAEVTVLAAPNRAPEITPIDDVTLVEGETVFVTAAVTDPDGDEVQIAVETGFLASNITVDEGSGEITFVTEAGVDGAGEGYYSVTVVATDGRDGESAVTFLLTVEPSQVGGVQELAIRAALVSPTVGTAEDLFSFGAVVTTAEGDPDSVTLTVVSDGGAFQEAAMGAVGEAGASGARYGADLQLSPGVYTFTVVATAAGETVTRDEDGPVVEEALIDISNVVASGVAEDISILFDLSNPNPGQTVTIGVEFRDVGSEAWLPASVSGSISALRNGSHAFTWHSGSDVPDALGETYQLRLTAGTSGERISDGFAVVNASPTPPTLDELEPSAESSLVITGITEFAGADIDVILGDTNVGTTTAEGDGTFRFVTADLQPGAYEVRATASILGVSSVKSAPIEVVVDSALPTLEIVSPERSSEMPTLEPLISFRVDFGLSGGDSSEVAVALNGKTAAVSFDETSELYSVRETLFDQRLYLVSVRASKYNGLTLSDAWAFTVNLAAGDTIAPTAVSFEPTGSISESSPTVKLVVSDGETGIDTASVELLLNGVLIDAPYSPKDTNGGTASGIPTDPLVDGDYTASATFADLAGNPGEVEWSFAVDTTPPAPPTFTTPVLDVPAVTSDATFTVQGDAEAESEVVVVVSGVVVGTVTPGAGGSWAFSVDLTAGTTDVQAQARDALQNVSALSDPVSIVWDAEAPQLTLATPALETATPNLQPTFSGSATDVLSGIDPASVILEIDSTPVGVIFDEAAGTFTYDAEAPFVTGSTILIRVAATDGAGNPAEINGSITFDAALSDITAPAILNPQINGIGLVSGSATLIQTSDATIAFVVTDDVSGVERVFGTLDGVEVELAVADTSATLDLVGLAEGSHVLLVSAADVAGNVGEPQQYDFLLDVGTTPPVLSAPDLTNASDLVVTGTGIEDGATVSVLLNGVPVETTVQGTEFQTGVVSLDEGENIITATATDAVGNTADGDPIVVILDTAAPELAFLEPLADSTVNADTDTIVIRASDSTGIDTTRIDLTVDGETVDPVVDGDGTIIYVAPQPFASSGTAEPASHFASIVVGDLAGNTSRLGAAFYVDGKEPLVEGFIPSENEIVPSIEPTISATIVADDLDLDSVDVSVSAQGEPRASIVGDANYEIDAGTGQFSYFPLLEDKTTYEVVVTAADKVGNVVISVWAFAIDTDAEDTNAPSTTILFPAPGENINEVSLDILSFAVGDAAGVGGVTMFVNDPTGTQPLSIGRLEEEGIAEFNRRTGVIRIRGSKLLARQGARGGFSFDPLELNALERNLTGGDNASFDPLELNALERSLGGDSAGGGGADVGALEKSLSTGAGAFGAGANTMGVQVLDLSGNVSFASWSFEVTLDPPAAPTFSATTALRNSRSAAIDGLIPGLAATGGLPIKVALSVNGNSAGVLDITSEDGEFVFDNVNLSDGDNLITATASDSAGNLSDRSQTLAVVLDEEAPTIAIDPVPAEASTTFFTITGSISDNQPVDLGSVVLHMNDDEIELSKTQGRFTQNITLGDGSNELQVVVEDAAGNETKSETYTVTLDLAPPTTAPDNITALPTADSRGIRVGWTTDANASSYNIYRSLIAFTDATALTPVAASVDGGGYTDTTVLPGRMAYYAVASVDGAGNFDASVLSPVLAVALMKDAGGVAALDDGTSLRVPRNGLFANALLTGTVEIATPSSAPELTGGIDGTAREVTVRTSTGAIVNSFNIPAALTHRVPLGVTISADSPQTYQLSAQDWDARVGTTNAQLRTVTADITSSGVFQLGEASAAAPWDVNGDNTVNIIDLVTVARLFGQTVGAGEAADANGDGVVNIIDLVTVSSHFGETTGPIGAPSFMPQGAPVVNIYTRVVESARGVPEVEIVAESSVNLAGYEVAIDPGAGEIKSMTRGDIFGRETFWMDPAPANGATRVASVRLDIAGSSYAVRKDGVLARLTVDSPATGVTPEVWLRDIRFTNRKGELLPYRIGPPPPLERAFSTALLPNYPNPFNPETWLPFMLSEASEVTLRIYDTDGQAIRTLQLGAREAGSYASRYDAAYWDGRNQVGEPVASGVYFYELRAGAYRELRRMVILK